MEKYVRFLTNNPPPDVKGLFNNLKSSGRSIPLKGLVDNAKEQLALKETELNAQSTRLYFIDRKNGVNGFLTDNNFKEFYNSQIFKARIGNVLNQKRTQDASELENICRDLYLVIATSFEDALPSDSSDPCGNLDTVVVIPSSDATDKMLLQEHFTNLAIKGLAEDSLDEAITLSEFTRIINEYGQESASSTFDDFWSKVKVIKSYTNEDSLLAANREYINLHATKWRNQDLLGFDPSIDLSQPFLGFEIQATQDDPTNALNLIQDNYSPTFMDAFASHYQQSIAQLHGSSDTSGSLVDVKNWKVQVDGDPNKTKVDSGLYNLSFDGTAQFSPQGVSFQNVSLKLNRLFSLREWDAKTNSQLSQNPLLYLPFDTPLQDTPNKDFGVKAIFSSQPANSILFNAEGDQLKPSTSGFVDLTVNLEGTQSGNLVNLTGSGTKFSLDFSPSVPVKLSLQAADGSALPSDIYYGFLKLSQELFAKADYGNITSLFTWQKTDDPKATVADSLASGVAGVCKDWDTPRDLAHLSLPATLSATALNTTAYVPLQTVLALACSPKELVLKVTHFDGTVSPARLPADAFLGGTGNQTFADKIGIFSSTDPKALLTEGSLALQTILDLANAGKVRVQTAPNQLILRWSP